MSTSNGEYATVIGPDAVFRGDLEFQSSARVLGRIEGAVSSTGKILIAEGSECQATVKAQDVTVEGMLSGNVEAADRVAVSATGQVHGDIQAARMTMDEGATVNGFCRIGVGNGSSRAASGAAASASRPADNGQPKSEEEAEVKPAAKAAAPAKR